MLFVLILLLLWISLYAVYFSKFICCLITGFFSAVSLTARLLYRFGLLLSTPFFTFFEKILILFFYTIYCCFFLFQYYIFCFSSRKSFFFSLLLKKFLFFQKNFCNFFSLFSYNVSIAKKPLLQYTFFDTITYENTLY